ncbi:DUF7305 domain-containing protein [Aquibacillus kalidii]|uniref:DUF7305 domain-containing protein n=1 Tax=Aquibacillus kalidii TaxID=2762597 RepID=UPI001648F36A|nr:PilX N-terminal domain-containing pilus assembly protein [Aquibacillus kalidii]
MRIVKSRGIGNERGATLVMVLMVFTVLTVLGLGLLGVAVSNTKLSTVDREYQATYYIAEAGMTKRFSEIQEWIQNNKNAGDLTVELLEEKTLPANTFEKHFNDTPTATVKVEKIDDENYKIVSVGQIGKRSRTVEKEFKVNWGSSSGGGGSFPVDMAVYTNEDIIMSGSATITGDAGTNSIKSNSVELNGKPVITGNLYVPHQAVDIALKKPNDVNINVVGRATTMLKLPQFPSFPEFDPLDSKEVVKSDSERYYVIQNHDLRIDSYLTDGYTLELTKNVAFNEIIVQSNYSLNIDTNGQDRSMVVDYLNIKNGHINILGGGSLTLYVKKSIELGSSSSINNGGIVHDLRIYLKGDNEGKELMMSGDQRIFGFVYAESADFQITGSAGLKGYLLTAGDEVKISGGTYSPSFIFAPNAEVDLNGGAQIVGAIISNSFKGTGGTEVTYQKTDLDFLSGDEDENTGGDLIVPAPQKETTN